MELVNNVAVYNLYQYLIMHQANLSWYIFIKSVYRS